MKIYQVIQSQGEWEDYHEFVVYTTFDRAKAEYVKHRLQEEEARLMSRPRWECWYEPSSFSVDSHAVDKADYSEYAFIDTMLNQRGKLRSPVFFSRSGGIEDNIDEVLKQDVERMISA
ncbi:hypothetical protein [Allisonella histaminiformans]|uniref:hypothetical protein n=1 Tax=Allisonella histaminiformans TaxID=209880 RepID=UPI002E768A38|nr:hypothetical protein [Allisonella histaminiformans]